MTLHSSFLPVPAPILTSTVLRFHQLTSTQLHRLHYKATNPGAYVRSRRHLTRLTKLGYLKRFWGIYNGPPEYVYLPPDSKARTANMHTLDISELYIRLAEPLSIRRDYKRPVFDPEPWCYVQVGKMTLKPDAYIDTGPMRFFVEMDRSTQFRAVLAEKMRRYIQAYERWEEPTFPQVLFVCHDPDRQRFIHNVIKSQAEPRLFQVCLFADYLNVVEGNNHDR